MIKEPKIGMTVKVVDGQHCGGHDTGTVGTIRRVNGPDSFLVINDKKEDYLHCRKCVESLETEESYAVTSEAGTAVKTASNSPSGVRTVCLPVADREDAAISQQSQLDSRETMSSPKGDSE